MEAKLPTRRPALSARQLTARSLIPQRLGLPAELATPTSLTIPRLILTRFDFVVRGQRLPDNTGLFTLQAGQVLDQGDKGNAIKVVVPLPPLGGMVFPYDNGPYRVAAAHPLWPGTILFLTRRRPQIVVILETIPQ